MAPYEIIVDAGRHTVRATLSGFWDMPTLLRYVADIKAAGTRVAAGGASNWWLINIGGQVQAREVAEALGARLPSALPSNAMVAIFMRSGLTAIQVKRVVTNERHRHFAALADAEQWLAEHGMPA